MISYDDGSKFLSFRETFVDEKITIVSAIILPEGDHSFPFETVLPENCPPSFKGKYGYILYEVIIIVPKMIFHEKVPFEFTVLSKVIIPSAMERKVSFICYIFNSFGILLLRKSLTLRTFEERICMCF